MGDIVTADIGGRLRHARERCGLSLQAAASKTKLSVSVLQAIERNDFGSLPEGLYRRAYIRTLAAEFGLDAGELAADYCASYEPPVAAAVESRDHSYARPLEQLDSPRRSLVTLAVLAALAAAWFWLQYDPVEPPVRADDHPGEALVLRTSRDATTDVSARHAGAVARVAAIDRPSEVPLRIEMAAADWCWVAAESDGERALYRLVEPGERVILEGQRMISLRLGNAGSVTLSINDGPRRAAGGAGEVVELTLTPDNADALRDGTLETVSGH